MKYFKNYCTIYLHGRYGVEEMFNKILTEFHHDIKICY
jgi:hypothetical protein